MVCITDMPIPYLAEFRITNNKALKAKGPIVKELVDGLNECDNAEYHADRKYISSSVLKKIYKSLDEYYLEYVLGNKKEHSKATLDSFDLGSLTHSYILEPDKVLNDFNFFKGFRKQGPEYEEFLANAAAGKPIISGPQKHRVEQLIEAYKRRPEAVNLIKNGFAEQTICGTLNNVPIKVRFDWINVEAGYIADVKTTGYPADLESFKLTCDGLSYNLSAALYCAMAEQFYGKKFDFYFIVLSKKDVTCEVFKIGEQTMLEGKRIVAAACAKYVKAKESNVWTELVEPSTITAVDSNYEIKEI